MGRRVVLIALWLGMSGAAAAPQAPVETPCDRLAALPDDADLPKGFLAVAENNIVDPGAAVAACREALASAPDDRRVHFQLGRALDHAGRVEEAKAEYEKAAEAGSAKAMRNLGLLYVRGEGGPENFAAARLWFAKAAARGDVGGMNNLGAMYKDGEGVPTDYKAARQWFERAAAAGAPGAMTNLGILAEDGKGVPRDYVAARKWYEKAAAKGEPQAMIKLGALYYNGQGVPNEL